MGLINWVKNLGSNVLYYPGCLTKGVLSKEFENYKEIFNRLGIDFILLSKDESCCGLPILNAGYRKDARKLAKKNFDLFKKHSVTKIITNCPACHYMFKKVYPKLVHDWNIKVEHATVTILEALKKRRVKFRGSDVERELVNYHDPCYLGRYSGIYDEPRKLIELLGGKIVEMRFNRENALCCGAGGGVYSNSPDIAKKIAVERVKFVLPDATRIVSPCGLCYLNLKSASEKSTEFSSFVLGKLRGFER
ncbi:(Fe-S)-binding protein [Candidatus Pacearchaeota archaeon]|nr:(Fe-S)-binding protein [Candidatus Pacearchaeota archaeon]